MTDQSASSAEAPGDLAGAQEPPADFSRRALITGVAAGGIAGGGAAFLLRQLMPQESPLTRRAEASVRALADDTAMVEAIERHLGLFLPELHALPDDHDHQAIRRAAEAATEAGGGTVLLTRPTYELSAPVCLNGLHNVTFESRSQSVIRAAEPIAALRAFVGEAAGVDADGLPATDGGSRITFRGITFDGGLVNGEELDEAPFADYDEAGRRIEEEKGAFARDSRKYAPDGAKLHQPRQAIQCAVFIAANGDPSFVTGPTFRDISIENVRLLGIASLPVYLRGVRGFASVDDSYAYRCLDIGFTSCESVRFTRNRIEYSADNGVSLSRGNSNVTCANNIITKAYSFGIHLGGFQGDEGPSHVSCTGNTVIHAGSAGINLYDAPKDVTITGNLISDVHRGADGKSAGAHGYAVLIQGTADKFARNIVITGNNFVRAHRGGVCLVRNVEDVLISSNIFRRIGLPSHPDGADTEMGAGWWNFAIGRPGPPTADAKTVRRIVANSNAMFEDRDAMLHRKPRRLYSVWTGGADIIATANYASYAHMEGS